MKTIASMLRARTPHADAAPQGPGPVVHEPLLAPGEVKGRSGVAEQSPQPRRYTRCEIRLPTWWWLLGVSLTWGILCGPADAEGDAAPNLERAFISFRVGTPQWRSEQRLEELLALLEKYTGVTDEITLFHSITHAPLPLDEAQRRLDVASQRMARIRQLGYRTGLNVLTTIGHHEEDLPRALTDEYTPMTDIHGNICRGSRCPNDPRMREYIRRLYQLVATAGPDYIWIDDDVRLAGHMPIHLTCFCDHCLGIFGKESATLHTRDSLREAFVTGTETDRLSLRRAWLDHNRATIARLFTLIEATVHEQKPGLPLGFMTGERFYEGYDFARWAEILSGPGRAEVFWRPGGGFYNDEHIPGLAQKSHQVGRQVAGLPREVVSIQSEIENFPYHRLKKSAHITVLEAASHIAAGCTGTAFNVLGIDGEPLDEYESMVARIRGARPFFDLLVRHLGRSPRVGVFPFWCKDSAATSDLAGGNWTAFTGFLDSLTPGLLELGLPASYSPEGASVTLLSGDILAPLSDEQVREVLSGGVYMDAFALDYLNGRGFGDLTGFATEKSLHRDCIEQLAAHPLNGPFAGRVRDSRQSFNHWPAAVLQPTAPKAEALSGLVDYGDQQVAACTMGVFENHLGGRICVAGYFPWTFLHNLSKSAQVKSVLRWLSKDQLPAYVESFHKVNLWVTEPAGDRMALAMTNASFDEAEGLALMLRTEAEEIRVLDMDGDETLVRGEAAAGPYRRFVLPPIEAWQMRLVLVEENAADKLDAPTADAASP